MVIITLCAHKQICERGVIVNFNAYKPVCVFFFRHVSKVFAFSEDMLVHCAHYFAEISCTALLGLLSPSKITSVSHSWVSLILRPFSLDLLYNNRQDNLFVFSVEAFY